jgi:predicted nucleotidyltransferase component of viral defense system
MRFADYRFSEDLDFTLTRPISLEEILARLNEIFAAIEAACGLRIAFDREDRHGHQNSHTFTEVNEYKRLATSTILLTLRKHGQCSFLSVTVVSIVTF